MRRLALTLFILCLTGTVNTAASKEGNVAPGINAPYTDARFEDWQAVFESENREVYAKRQTILVAMRLKPGMMVADIGAGTGLFTRLFAPAVGQTGKIYAVDISHNFIEAIQQQATNQGLNNVIGIVNPPDSTALPVRSIDLAFLCDTYHHFEYPQTMLASIRQSLRPGGQLVVIDYEKIPQVSSNWVLGHVRADKATVIREIEFAGFRLLEDLPLLTENYFLRFEKIE